MRFIIKLLFLVCLFVVYARLNRWTELYEILQLSSLRDGEGSYHGFSAFPFLMGLYETK